ncbi:MAG: hypothetical protein ABSD64_03675 [Terriglobales bacterium]|jgi:hypothetical protein
MAQLRKVLLAIGKVFLTIVLGFLAFIVASSATAFLFGGLHGLFGWPVPAFGTQNLVLLAVFVVVYLVYREGRKQKR